MGAQERGVERDRTPVLSAFSTRPEVGGRGATQDLAFVLADDMGVHIRADRRLRTPAT